MAIMFDFNIKGHAMITMYYHINNVIEEVPKLYISGAGSTTASSSNLYSVRELCERNKLLIDNEREEYHTFTARCVYISEHGRPEIKNLLRIPLHTSAQYNTG